MNGIHDAIFWLDSHNGTSMVLLTLAYVVCTLLMVREMRRSNKLSQELERGRNRPFVVFYVESRDRCFYAVIKNFGSQPAFFVRTTVAPDIPRAHDGRPGISFVENVLPMLAPGMQIDDSLGATPIYLQKVRDTFYNTTVYYKDSLGKEYHEPGTVAFEHFRNRMSSHPETAQDKMAQSLDRAERAMDSLAASASQLTWVINNAVNRPSPPTLASSTQHDDLASADLSEDELNYLSNIGDPRNDGYISCAIASSFHGEEDAKFYKMMDRFLTLGLARKELDRLVLTDRAYKLIRRPNLVSCEQVGDSLEGRGATVGPCAITL